MTKPSTPFLHLHPHILCPLLCSVGVGLMVFHMSQSFFSFWAGRGQTEPCVKESQANLLGCGQREPNHRLCSASLQGEVTNVSLCETPQCWIHFNVCLTLHGPPVTSLLQDIWTRRNGARDALQRTHLAVMCSPAAWRRRGQSWSPGRRPCASPLNASLWTKGSVGLGSMEAFQATRETSHEHKHIIWLCSLHDWPGLSLMLLLSTRCPWLADIRHLYEVVTITVKWGLLKLQWSLYCSTLCHITSGWEIPQEIVFLERRWSKIPLELLDCSDLTDTQIARPERQPRYSTEQHPLRPVRIVYLHVQGLWRHVGLCFVLFQHHASSLWRSSSLNSWLSFVILVSPFSDPWTRGTL